jgi:hypothetical protein
VFYPNNLKKRDEFLTVANPRAGLEAIVRSNAGLEIAGTGAPFVDQFTAMREFAPDALLVDAVETSVARLLSVFGNQFSAPAIVVLIESARRSDIVLLLHWVCAP